MAKRKPTLFGQWLTAMGFNGKQVSKGGALLGLGNQASVRRNLGDVESELVEQFAMSALRAGLPPWSPKTDAEIAAVGEVRRFMLAAVENQRKRAPKTSA